MPDVLKASSLIYATGVTNTGALCDRTTSKVVFAHNGRAVYDMGASQILRDLTYIAALASGGAVTGELFVRTSDSMSGNDLVSPAETSVVVNPGSAVSVSQLITLAAGRYLELQFVVDEEAGTMSFREILANESGTPGDQVVGFEAYLDSLANTAFSAFTWKVETSSGATVATNSTANGWAAASLTDNSIVVTPPSGYPSKDGLKVRWNNSGGRESTLSVINLETLPAAFHRRAVNMGNPSGRQRAFAH